MPTISLTSGKRLAQLRRGVEHAAAVGVRGVEHQEVDLGPDQRRGALEVVARGADRRADAQAAELVLAGVRVLDRLLDVLDRDQPLEVAVPVDHEHLLDAVLVELGLGLLERRPLGDGDQVLLGHQLADRLVEVLLEAQVAVGEDADQVTLRVGHRHARDLVAGHHLERLADALVGAHGDGIDDHPRLAALHPVHLLGLHVDRHVLVDDADPPLLGEGDGQARLGHRVHGRGEDRDVHLDPAADLGPQLDLVRVDLGEAGDDRDVVEREGEAGLEIGHAYDGSFKTKDGSTRARGIGPGTSEDIRSPVKRAADGRPRFARIPSGGASAHRHRRAVALLVLLARAAGAGVVAAHLGVAVDGGLRALALDLRRRRELDLGAPPRCWRTRCSSICSSVIGS